MRLSRHIVVNRPELTFTVMGCHEPESMRVVAGLNNYRLRFQRDAKLITHRELYSLSKRENLRAACTAEIHQHQRMLLVNTGATQAPALPARLLNQPTGGNFHVAFVHGKVGQGFMQRTQAFKLVARDHRVFKETARIADLRGVGQLTAANINDR